MSRSYKKTPIMKYGHDSSFGKKMANKKVRHNYVSNFCNYKKLYDRYDIYDIKDNFYRKHGYNKWQRRPMTIEEINEYWRK